MVESNSEVVIDPEGEKFCQILLGYYEGQNSSRSTRLGFLL